MEWELTRKHAQLDLHLAKLLKKQKRKDQTKLVLKGIWTFLKTPIGVCAGICTSCLRSGGRGG